MKRKQRTRRQSLDRTLNPSAAGRAFGVLKPSQLGIIKITTGDNKVKIIRANRKERRHGNFTGA